MGTDNYGYQYDTIGNRITVTNNAEIVTYLANALNQYTNIHDSITVGPSCDADGNMTNYGAFAFVWDGENRLISVFSNGSAVASYNYDYMGRRYRKVVGSATNTFLYDGWAMIREQSATVTNSYVYGLDLSGSMQGAGTIGGILRASLNGVVAFPAYDGNGNLTDLTGTNGASLAHYEYDPYGNTIVQTGSLPDANPFRFSTKYYDSETGLYCYGLRYYGSSLGRWISRDPIDIRGGLNLYGFVGNQPVQRHDYLGLFGCSAKPAPPKALLKKKLLCCGVNKTYDPAKFCCCLNGTVVTETLNAAAVRVSNTPKNPGLNTWYTTSSTSANHAWIEWGYSAVIGSSTYYRDFNAGNNTPPSGFGGGPVLYSKFPGITPIPYKIALINPLNPCKHDFDKLRATAKQKADAFQAAGDASVGGNCFDFVDQIVAHALKNSCGCTMSEIP